MKEVLERVLASEDTPQEAKEALQELMEITALQHKIIKGSHILIEQSEALWGGVDAGGFFALLFVYLDEEEPDPSILKATVAGVARAVRANLTRLKASHKALNDPDAPFKAAKKLEKAADVCGEQMAVWQLAKQII